MWGFEFYVFEHQEATSGAAVAVALKGLHDNELFSDAAFVEYYDGDGHNKGNPGHNLVRKAKQVDAFVEWLKEDSDSDSGSDSD